MDRNCSNCQASLPEGATTCPSCGHAVVVKKKVPLWLWIVLGFGCGCPIAIVLIGLLATLIVPNVLERYASTSRDKARSGISSLVNALNEYAIRNRGEYPESLEALVTPDANGYTYLNAKQVPLDPWKHPYQYEAPVPDSGEHEPRVWSNGRDGLCGGQDDIDSRTMNND